SVRIRVLRTRVVVIVPRDLLRGDVADKTQSLSAIVILDVVPAIDHLESTRKMALGRRGAKTEMVVGNRPGEQGRPRVVPVAVALDPLRAGAGDKFAEIELKDAVLAFGLPTHVGLLDVPHDVLGVGRGRVLTCRDDVERTAKAKVNLEADRLRC